MRPAAALALVSAVPLALLAGCLDPERGGKGSDPGPLASGSAWTLGPDLPSARTEASAVAAGGRVWVLGGILDGPNGGAAGEVWSLDPAAGSWERGPDLPGPVHHAAVAVANDEIHVIGGFTGSPQFVPTAAVWVLDALDPSTGWRPAPPLPRPRGGGAAAGHGADVWLVGGYGGSPVYLGPDRLLLDDAVLRLGPGEQAWTQEAVLPDPRDHLAAAVVGDRLFAIGGRDLTLDTNTGRVDVLDLATGAWAQAPDLPTPRGGLAAAVLDGHVVVAGGESMGGTFAKVEAYDPSAGTWAEWPPMPEARHGLGLAALDGALYAIAGGPEPAFTYSATVQRLARAG